MDARRIFLKRDFNSSLEWFFNENNYCITQSKSFKFLEEKFLEENNNQNEKTLKNEQDFLNTHLIFPLDWK